MDEYPRFFAVILSDSCTGRLYLLHRGKKSKGEVKKLIVIAREGEEKRGLEANKTTNRNM